MNLAEKLRDYVRQEHPDASVELTQPLNAGGMWSIDIDLADKHLAVEWSTATHFAVSTVTGEGFGERPDEAYASLEATQRRVSELLTSNKQTSPQYALPLSWLRERRGLTQQALAEKLGVKQATLSGIERRRDIQLNTLRRFLEALGGRLEIFGVFANARYAIESTYPGGDHLPPLGVGDTETPRRKMSSIHYEEVFPTLRESGNLQYATDAAGKICSRHAVIEFP